jgi:hypothetical protein
VTPITDGLWLLSILDGGAFFLVWVRGSEERAAKHNTGMRLLFGPVLCAVVCKMAT